MSAGPLNPSPLNPTPLNPSPLNGGALAARRLEQGWSFVAIGSDSTLLAAAVTAEFGRARTTRI